MKAIELTVGRLLCGTVRDYLGRLKVLGHNIEWHESSGILSRRFTIRCDDRARSAVRLYLKGGESKLC